MNRPLADLSAAVRPSGSSGINAAVAVTESVSDHRQLKSLKRSLKGRQTLLIEVLVKRVFSRSRIRRTLGPLGFAIPVPDRCAGRRSPPSRVKRAA